MNDLNKWTVYVHINKINNKFYVGITSQDVKVRWGNGSNYKTSPYFYNSIQKYGWDNFEHEIIANNLIEEEAKNFEIILINKLNSNNDKYGYNLTSGGDGVLGYKHTVFTKNKLRDISLNMSDDTKKKMSESKVGTKLSKEHKEKIKNNSFGKGVKSVVQYELSGKFIKKWDSLTQASKYLKIQIGDISSCCNNKKKSAGGFMWKMFSDDLINKDITPYSLKYKINI